MTLARAEGKAALARVITNVFGDAADGPLAKALAKAGYNDIRDVLALSENDLDDLVCDDNGAEKRVPRFSWSKIKLLSLLFHDRAAQGNPITQ